MRRRGEIIGKLRAEKIRRGMREMRVLRVAEGEDGVRLGDLFRVMDEWAGN